MSTQDVQNFAGQVLQAAPPDIPAGILRDAVESFRQADRTSRADLPDCIREARRAFDRAQPGHDRPTLARGSAGPDPEVQAVAESIMESYRSEVEALRVELFGSPDPPFQSIKDAAQWIEQEFRLSNERRSKRDPQEVRARWEELGRLQQDLIKYLERPIEFNNRIVSLEYLTVATFKATGQPDRQGLHGQEIPLRLNSPLYTLKRVIREIEIRTGFDEHRLVAWILAGVSLLALLPRISVASSLSPTPGRLPKTTITIWKREITNKDLREDVFRVIKDDDVPRGPRLKDVDLEIIDIVNEKGSLPEKAQGKGRGNYWQEVAESLASRGYRDIKGPAAKRRCDRLRKTVHRHLLPSWLQ